MTATLDWAEFAAREFEPASAHQRWATPGALARHMDPNTVQTAALDLLDANLVDVAEGRCRRLIWSMPPQEGKPVVKWAMILMGDGSRRRLSDVKIGDTVVTHLGRPKKVTAVFEQGTLPVVTITTHAGRIVTAALDHPFLTPTGWVNAGDLQVGDVLAAVHSPQTEPEATLTPEAARLLGYFIGDGSTTISAAGNLSAAIACADEVEGADIAHCAASLGFGLSIASRPGNRASMYLLSKGVRPWLRLYGLAGKSSWTKRVPSEIYTQPKEIIAHFIGAYFATDGTVSRRGGARPDARVEFNSVSRELLADVQHLLLRLGIATTLRAKNQIMKGKPYTSWRLLMRRQDDVMKFRAVVPIYHAKTQVLGDWPLRRTEFDTQYVSDPIVDIKTGEEAECRCLTVEDDHTFTAEDLVVHNSERTSRRFPLWLLVRNPDLRIAIVSYEMGVARRWGRAIRNDIAEHPELGLTVRADTSAAHEWQLDGHRGGVYSVGIGGALTGRPVDVLLIDDPLKGRKEADSEAYRQACKDFYTDTARTRLAPDALQIIIQTRWHEDDLSGWLLAGPSGHDWRYINVPAQSENEADPLGRAPGEYLISARGRAAADWEATKRDVGSRTWAALYQGAPAPTEGTLFKRQHWRWYAAPRWEQRPDGTMWVHGADELIQSWDMAFKDTKKSDFVVGQVWAKFGAEVYLLDQVRERLDFPATAQAVKALSVKWPQAHAKLVEDKANGPAIIAQLRSTVSGLIAVTPQDSKYARASSVAPFQEAGNVYLPDPSLAPWIGDYVIEHTSFPNAAHDDQVDTTSQALNRLLGSQSGFDQAKDWLKQFTGTAA